MMRSFVTLGSHTWSVELDQEQDESDTMPFPWENSVMIVYGGRRPSGRHQRWALLESYSVLTSPSACPNATNPSSYTMMGPSQLSSSLS
jgi:hypothetical protein